MYDLDNESILNIIKLSNSILSHEKDKNNLSLPFSLFYQHTLHIPYKLYIESSLSYLNNIEDSNQNINHSFNNNENDSEKDINYSIDPNSDSNLEIQSIINLYQKNLEKFYQEQNNENQEKSMKINPQNTNLKGAKKNEKYNPNIEDTKKIINNKLMNNDNYENKKDNSYDYSNKNMTISNDNAIDDINKGNHKCINNYNNHKSYSNDKIKNNEKQKINNKNDKTFYETIKKQRYINYSLYNKDYLFINHEKNDILKIKNKNEITFLKENGQKRKDALLKEKEILTTILINKICPKNDNDIKEKKENKYKENLLEINLTRNFTPDEKLEKKRQLQKERQLKRKKKGVPQIDFKVDIDSILRKYDEVKLENLIKDSKK